MSDIRVRRLAGDTVQHFIDKFRIQPSRVCTAPGRINIIGEHTDYTGGLVLPAAIDRSIVTAVSPSSTDLIRGYSVDYDEPVSCKPGEYNPEHPSVWFRYVMGVLDELQKSGHPVTPFDFCVHGDVPIGSGLSSSAALSMSVLTSLEALFTFHLSDDEAALLCQRVENNFVGVQCGIMDMLISRTGKKGNAVMIDCSDLSLRFVELDSDDCSWLVIDSGKRRGLVTSEYNDRRQQCEDVLSTVKVMFPERNIQCLRYLGVEDLPLLQNVLSPVHFRRARHVITENDRVKRMMSALEASDCIMAGELLAASHASLRDDYEVSCAELDLLVDVVTSLEGVYGARIMGAGFGGSVLALATNSIISRIQEALDSSYNSSSGYISEIIPVEISDGARRLD